MSTTAEISEPASELERLIADLPGSGLVAFVFGIGWWVAHLDGVTTHVFRGEPRRIDPGAWPPRVNITFCDSACS